MILVIAGVLAGGVVTGLINFFLQRLQDRRRFAHELDVQKQRWEQENQARKERWQEETAMLTRRWEREDEVQQQRWDREGRLRNYDERRNAYTSLEKATTESRIAQAMATSNMSGLIDYMSEAMEASAEIRTIAPSTVWYVGHLLVFAFTDYAQKVSAGENTEEAAEKLKNRHAQFTQIAQHDLGLVSTDDKSLNQLTKSYSRRRNLNSKRWKLKENRCQRFPDRHTIECGGKNCDLEFPSIGEYYLYRATTQGLSDRTESRHVRKVASLLAELLS